MDQLLYDFYSQPQSGAGIFIGTRLPQVGGGILGGIGRLLIPIAKFIGKNLFDIGVNTGKSVLYDNKPVGKAILDSTFDQADRLLNNSSKVDRFINKQKLKRKKYTK